MKYVFGKRENNSGFTVVSASDRFGKTGEFGFVTEVNPELQDLGTNFVVPAESKCDSDDAVEEDERGCFSKVHGVPLRFKTSVLRNGNYSISVTLSGSGKYILFAGARRLAAVGCLTEGKDEKIDFLFNVSDFIPRDSKTLSKRTELAVSLLSDGVALAEFEATETRCPTMYLCGDSTVTDQPADMPYRDMGTYAGWGQMIPSMLNGIAVSNQSHSGLSTETFRGEGHYSIVQSAIRPGDYIVFQFGHNDQKVEHLGPDTGYRENLVRFLKEASEAGAHSILVTSIARNTWTEDGKYDDRLFDWTESVKRIGAEFDVPVIDLHEHTMNIMKQDGYEASTVHFHPDDKTHTNDVGAYAVAVFVAKELAKLSEKQRFIPNAVRKDIGKWEHIYD